jgi:hypothetical protein
MFRKWNKEEKEAQRQESPKGAKRTDSVLPQISKAIFKVSCVELQRKMRKIHQVG